MSYIDILLGIEIIVESLIEVADVKEFISQKATS
jgi:hypothetical protein